MIPEQRVGSHQNSPRSAGDAPRWGIVPATVASPPDPAVIAKLANELFVAFSGNPMPPAGALASASPPVSAAGGSAVLGTRGILKVRGC